MRTPFQQVAAPRDSALGAPPTLPPPDRMHRWIQIGGDMDPSGHGAYIARADESGVHVDRIENFRDHVGDEEAAQTPGKGHFFSDGWYFDWDEMDMREDPETWERLCAEFGFEFPEQCEEQMDAFFRAEALTSHEGAGSTEQGSSRDVLPVLASEIEWWGDQESAAAGFDEEDDWFRYENIRRDRAARQTEQLDRLPLSAQDQWHEWWKTLPLKFPWPWDVDRRLGKAA